MSAQRKNSKALRRVRAAGLHIDGNFITTYEAIERTEDNPAARLILMAPHEVYQDRLLIKTNCRAVRMAARVLGPHDPPGVVPRSTKFKRGFTPRPWTVKTPKTPERKRLSDTAIGRRLGL